jgi:hypothetical protein
VVLSSLLNTSNPKFKLSIITCSLSDYEGLSRTLKSVKGLIGIDVEHILVLSNYGTEQIELVRKQIDLQFSQILQCAPQGIYGAMNSGLNLANSVKCTFINGGDEICDRNAMLDFLNSNTEADWGYAPIFISQPGSHVNRIYNFSPYRPLPHRLGIKYVPHPGTVYQTEALKKMGGYDANFKVAADQELALRFAKESNPAVGTDPYVIFYTGGASTRSHSQIMKDFRNISVRNFGYFFNSPFIDAIIWKVLELARILVVKLNRLK